MNLTPEAVEREYEWMRERADRIVPIVNYLRGALGDAFDVHVEPVGATQYQAVVDRTFADGDRAVNVAALTAILRDLDVADDYPGFVVDEYLGRELAAMIAGDQPLRMLGEATFHYADVHTHGVDGDVAAVDGEGGDVTGEGGNVTGEGGNVTGDVAGVDDLDAAIAAGVQERVPGWAWTESDSPFAVETARDRDANSDVALTFDR